jgi:hypothetical protein
MRKTPIPTATANYRSHQRQIKALLADIRLGLAKHARCQARDQQNWGYAGNVRGRAMRISLRAKSWRSSVLVNKNRNAETRMFIAEVGTPACDA